ncbi:hypothetical protein TVNIR_3087 [Thioalkalivibrio nitratireducens DSM 14787]|uniref:Uncharacterized protein n=1 Tax=Thioalkalivibrio nitratireducens (strain DSM 14787 / UNIQEM 213 / ALEN2) TaxID=1255043 RepID=L0E0E8_THIND|nr:hypothetical protein TVNIR_3087 [Thioalkalivibrio nitratireducens DSM 14787]
MYVLGHLVIQRRSIGPRRAAPGETTLLREPGGVREGQVHGTGPVHSPSPTALSRQTGEGRTFVTRGGSSALPW